MFSRQNRIPVLDIFAGPGGLGEGFSSFERNGNPAFRIALSIEKHAVAHQTLELRAFFREFEREDIPEDYYEFLRGKITRGTLFSRHPKQAEAAANEAWNATLGVVTAETLDARIDAALGDAKTWVLIGGPPCQAYSLVGRSRRGGIDPKDHRVYLYKEYLRILAEHAPPVFVMENVKGLLSSRVGKEEIVDQILSDLENPAAAIGGRSRNARGASAPSYRLYPIVREDSGKTLSGNLLFKPSDFVVRCEKFGIPQARHRIIIVGVRTDIEATELKPLKPKLPVSVTTILQGLPRLRSGLSKEPDSAEAWRDVIQGIEASGFIREMKSNGLATVAARMTSAAADLHLPRNDRGMEFIESEPDIGAYAKWFLDSRIKGVCNHTTRSHIRRDLYRYLFAACFGAEHGRSPDLTEFPKSLLPNHENVSDALSIGCFGDRFRVQVANRPSTTITSHISKDGHYYIHFDPTQCRSLTVREAARLQTFPDNYFFCGGRTEQYTQVGNAVPPLLARQIAERVWAILETKGGD